MVVLLSLSPPIWATGIGMDSPAWVLLAANGDGDTVAYARVVVAPGEPCPPIEPAGNGTSLAMTPRDNHHRFNVRVCEARVAFDTDYRIRLGDRVINLPRVRHNPARIIALGDTGCEASDKKHQQGCAPDDPAEPAEQAEQAKPFATVAATAANSGAVDLLLHMGDYNYRGTPHHLHFNEADGSSRKVSVYDAGDHQPLSANCQQAADSSYISQNDVRSDMRDAWRYWRDDFFRPAGRLLTAAPWLFARGNHELCSRAGPGWFYFLDGGSNLPGGSGQLSCPTPQELADPVPQLVFGQPYRVALGNLDLLMLDSANACDGFAPVEAVNKNFAQQFNTIAALASAQRPAWLLSHRPLNGVFEFDASLGLPCSDARRYGCTNQTLRAGLQASTGSLPEKVGLLLSGHIHNFQATVADGFPAQLIVGNSGVRLSGGGLLGKFHYSRDGRAATGVAIGRHVAGRAGGDPVRAFGYMDIRYQGGGRWQGSLMNGIDAGLVMVRCGSEAADRVADQAAVCELSQ